MNYTKAEWAVMNLEPKTIEYRVEDRGFFKVADGTEYPDFRVVLYVNGEWENEWDNGWDKSKAEAIADRMNKQLTEAA